MVEITIDVKFEQVAWVISGSTGLCWFGTNKAEPLQIKFINKAIYKSYRGISLNMILNIIREDYTCTPITTFYISHIFKLLNIYTKIVKYL